jgi:hypothetical protein
MSRPSNSTFKFIETELGDGAPKTPPVALESYAALLRAVNTVKNLSGRLVLSENRHGDLQVIRSAALEIIRHADVLIAQEQGE